MKTREARCLEIMVDGRKQPLHSSFCQQPSHSLSEPCKASDCPAWRAGQWSLVRIYIFKVAGAYLHLYGRWCVLTSLRSPVRIYIFEVDAPYLHPYGRRCVFTSLLSSVRIYNLIVVGAYLHPYCRRCVFTSIRSPMRVYGGY